MGEHDRGADAESLAFFGKINASLSHELMNVIATISELSGLLEDLTSLSAKESSVVSGEKLQAIGQKLDKQVKRGQELIRRLNRFSHLVDDPIKTIDVRQELADLADLALRFADLKEVRLETAFPDRKIEMTTDPFAFHQVVFLAFLAALQCAADQRKITFKYMRTDGSIRIVVDSADPMSTEKIDSNTTAGIQALMDRMNGGFEITQEGVLLDFSR